MGTIKKSETYEIPGAAVRRSAAGRQLVANKPEAYASQCSTMLNFIASRLISAGAQWLGDEGRLWE
jgi:hypothetical protein